MEYENKNAENRESSVPEATPQQVMPAVTSIPEIWGSNTTTQMQANVVKAQQMASTKHGMYAGIPMICKGDACPYKDTCWIPAANLVIGDRCPIEIGTLLELYEGYVQHFGLTDQDKVDQGLLKQLIDIELLMVRADKKMAASSDIVREVVDAINQRTGDVHYRKDIDPVLIIKNDLRKEHHRILTLLQGTRKDKKDTLLRGQDPSSNASTLLQRFKQMQERKVIDADVVLEQQVVNQEEVKPDESLGQS